MIRGRYFLSVSYQATCVAKRSCPLSATLPSSSVMIPFPFSSDTTQSQVYEEHYYQSPSSLSAVASQHRYFSSSDVTPTGNSSQPVDYRTSKDGAVGWPIDFDVASKVGCNLNRRFLEICLYCYFNQLLKID